eukprot:1120267-Pyramimonas_sp.AAC.2
MISGEGVVVLLTSSISTSLSLSSEVALTCGGVDEGEEVEAAALRELKEETGMTTVQMLTSLPGWVSYDFPPELMAKWLSEGRGWGGKYKGQ